MADLPWRQFGMSPRNSAFRRADHLGRKPDRQRQPFCGRLVAEQSQLHLLGIERRVGRQETSPRLTNGDGRTGRRRCPKLVPLLTPWLLLNRERESFLAALWGPVATPMVPLGVSLLSLEIETFLLVPLRAGLRFLQKTATSLRRRARSSSGASAIVANSAGSRGSTFSRRSSKARSKRSSCCRATLTRSTFFTRARPPRRQLGAHHGRYGKTPSTRSTRKIPPKLAQHHHRTSGVPFSST